MASTEYILSIDSNGSQATFKLKYKAGRFLSIQQTSGRLSQQQHERLLALAPQLEPAILLLQPEYTGRVTWEKVEKEVTLFQSFMNEYTTWYENRFTITPIIKAVDGATIKWLIANLRKLSGSDAETLAVWQLILNNWDQLEEWYRNQTELLQIKKNLNTILKQLKHGTSSEQKARAAYDASNDYREKL